MWHIYDYFIGLEDTHGEKLARYFILKIIQFTGIGNCGFNLNKIMNINRSIVLSGVASYQGGGTEGQTEARTM